MPFGIFVQHGMPVIYNSQKATPFCSFPKMRMPVFQQRHILRHLVSSGAPFLQHPRRQAIVNVGSSHWQVSGSLKFSTSATKSGNGHPKHDTNHGGKHDDKTMMDKVKETMHAGVDKVNVSTFESKFTAPCVAQKRIGFDRRKVAW